ncbi:MAG: hypothetical protein IJN40_06690 [Clostridia bacterium]|nr:hypothetical protein [Clostridia bacterium]
MKYSFIGLSKPVASLNNLLKTHIKSYRLSHVGETLPLEPGGVFSSNLSAAASFAGENDMCVYLTLEELVASSDIIFIFLPDKSIKNISLTLGKFDARNKIFCHMSSAFTSDILDFNSKNTYISWHFPYFIKDENDHSLPGRIIAEGYGKKLDSFNEALGLLSINPFYVSAEEKLMYIAASTIAKDLPVMLEYTAKRLIKYALGGHTELSRELMEMAGNNPGALNSYNPIDKDDVDFLARQLDILDKIGIDEITRLYSSLSAVAACTKDEPSRETERILMLTKPR